MTDKPASAFDSPATHPGRKPPDSGPGAVDGDPRWAAVTRRDPAADGQFVYAVRTTGVYARPSSAARLPRPENVEFFATPAEAEAAGYRASRRAAPDRSAVAARHAQLVAAACGFIRDAPERPGLDVLAARAGLAPHHFHRVFKAATGLTPAAYARAHRAQLLRDRLGEARSVTDGLHEAGFGSSSRFYETAGERLGMRPGEYRAGGAGTEIRFAVGECSLGSILVACSGRGICAIALGDDPDGLVRELQDQFPKAGLVGGDAGFEAVVAAVVGFVEDPAIGLELPLDVRGTAFQERVWQVLRQIPVGSTASYTEIARRTGRPAAVRAVARACGGNRLAVAIPCHRVVRQDGDLSGYRWGVERKRELLRRERE
ncbi:bifunctional DNA-binding transcriptional regulator/O6-methylguanine-DNA methyltransferase Ada [Lysobacter sp. GX 14042]|uniref:bifunctional DNA-binding transcriptional regulator/O6-methylguanine-DNA methyltransferase Ada n=1 Tax=Lysobacter sp. GX 14042 TaxID=2907155 RepID=UPI001F1A285E|nr:bifunctional DNA-binding transcriptional regulator/O6-methylguanine-DNA methyltransferase Ada [Lysobacter sp. GX 14042]MCE7031557.1 bifunctional DNA-binding transcriptional regulator/O6-methylguanine-DNA methyltransferase Ada [Lysobacter sp. GX 14042]